MLNSTFTVELSISPKLFKLLCYENLHPILIAFISRDVDDDQINELFFVVIPDTLGVSNRTVFTPGGAIVIGEDYPCDLIGVEAEDDPVLYLKRGQAYSHEDMWNVIDTSSTIPKAGDSFKNQRSIEALRQLNLVLKDNNKVGININEAKSVGLLQSSVGAVRYNGEIKKTFNGSQLFYHYLGAINHLDEQLEAEKTRNDELEQRLNELEQRLDRLTSPRPEKPYEDKKHTSQSRVLKVFPNPTKDIIQVEIGTEEKLENAELRIIDTMGNVALKQKIDGELSASTLNISNLNIQSGQYFCTLISAGKVVDTQTVTIIK